MSHTERLAASLRQPRAIFLEALSPSAVLNAVQVALAIPLRKLGAALCFAAPPFAMNDTEWLDTSKLDETRAIVGEARLTVPAFATVVEAELFRVGNGAVAPLRLALALEPPSVHSTELGFAAIPFGKVAAGRSGAARFATPTPVLPGRLFIALRDASFVEVVVRLGFVCALIAVVWLVTLAGVRSLARLGGARSPRLATCCLLGSLPIALPSRGPRACCLCSCAAAKSRARAVAVAIVTPLGRRALEPRCAAGV
mmetsp:Transcript_12263/g.31251  ORF Transcript_12263/g.31251 Transcript_12263/m.31251 type:complete len:255 (-) Transcript_12263:233-997(-)